MQPDGITHRDGAPFTSGLSNCKVPLFLMAGDRDKQCSPGSVRRLFDLLPQAAAHKYQCFGSDFGCAEHYGHFDLLIGMRVEQEVYPAIAAFLQASA